METITTMLLSIITVTITIKTHAERSLETPASVSNTNNNDKQTINNYSNKTYHILSEVLETSEDINRAPTPEEWTISMDTPMRFPTPKMTNSTIRRDLVPMTIMIVRTVQGQRLMHLLHVLFDSGSTGTLTAVNSQ